MAHPFFTIGHSTRPVSDFVDLLKGEQIELVADVRTVPRSRTNPQYNCDVLPETLAQFAIGYEHVAALGGLRPKAQEGAPTKCVLAKSKLSQLCRFRAEPPLPIRPRPAARPGTGTAVRDHVRGGSVVAVPPADHRGLLDRRGGERLPHSWCGSRRAGAHDRGRATARRRFAGLWRVASTARRAYFFGNG